MKMKSFLSTLIASLSLMSMAGPLAEKDLEAIKKHVNRTGEAAEWTWVFFGDSITHGALHTYGWRSFVEIFEERLRFEIGHVMDYVINSGNNGDNSGSCLKEHHYQRRVARYQPQVVIILIGCNDIVTTPIPTVKSNITQFVQRLRGDGIIPVLQTYNTIKFIENPDSDYIRRIMIRHGKFDEFNDVLRQIAAEQDVILVDNYKRWKFYTAEPSIMNFWTDDPLHPSARGHLEIANEILRTFGIYDTASKCCSAIAGGPNPPEVDAALQKLEKVK